MAFSRHRSAQGSTAPSPERRRDAGDGALPDPASFAHLSRYADVESGPGFAAPVIALRMLALQRSSVIGRHLESDADSERGPIFFP